MSGNIFRLRYDNRNGIVLVGQRRLLHIERWPRYLSVQTADLKVKT